MALALRAAAACRRVRVGSPANAVGFRPAAGSGM